jgi:tRNA(adenine34) deaminase
MCAKALVDARVSKLIFSTLEPKTGAITSIDNLYEKPFNHSIEYEHGLLQAESSKILKDFFIAKRN